MNVDRSNKYHETPDTSFNDQNNNSMVKLLDQQASTINVSSRSQAPCNNIKQEFEEIINNPDEFIEGGIEQKLNELGEVLVEEAERIDIQYQEYIEILQRQKQIQKNNLISRINNIKSLVKNSSNDDSNSLLFDIISKMKQKESSSIRNGTSLNKKEMQNSITQFKQLRDSVLFGGSKSLKSKDLKSNLMSGPSFQNLFLSAKNGDINNLVLNNQGSNFSQEKFDEIEHSHQFQKQPREENFRGKISTPLRKNLSNKALKKYESQEKIIESSEVTEQQQHEQQKNQEIDIQTSPNKKACDINHDQNFKGLKYFQKQISSIEISSIICTSPQLGSFISFSTSDENQLCLDCCAYYLKCQFLKCCRRKATKECLLLNKLVLFNQLESVEPIQIYIDNLDKFSNLQILHIYEPKLSFNLLYSLNSATNALPQVLDFEWAGKSIQEELLDFITKLTKLQRLALLHYNQKLQPAELSLIDKVYKLLPQWQFLDSFSLIALIRINQLEFFNNMQKGKFLNDLSLKCLEVSVPLFISSIIQYHSKILNLRLNISKIDGRDISSLFEGICGQLSALQILNLQFQTIVGSFNAYIINQELSKIAQTLEECELFFDYVEQFDPKDLSLKQNQQQQQQINYQKLVRLKYGINFHSQKFHHMLLNGAHNYSQLKELYLSLSQIPQEIEIISEQANLKKLKIELAHSIECSDLIFLSKHLKQNLQEFTLKGKSFKNFQNVHFKEFFERGFSQNKSLKIFQLKLQELNGINDQTFIGLLTSILQKPSLQQFVFLVQATKNISNQSFEMMIQKLIKNISHIRQFIFRISENPHLIDTQLQKIISLISPLSKMDILIFDCSELNQISPEIKDKVSELMKEKSQFKIEKNLSLLKMSNQDSSFKFQNMNNHNIQSPLDLEFKINRDDLIFE